MTNDPSMTIKEFCEAERVSRAMLYILWKQGKGPRFHCIGNQRRISHEARLEWRREREAETAVRKSTTEAA